MQLSKQKPYKTFQHKGFDLQKYKVGVLKSRRGNPDIIKTVTVGSSSASGLRNKMRLNVIKTSEEGSALWREHFTTLPGSFWKKGDMEMLLGRLKDTGAWNGTNCTLGSRDVAACQSASCEKCDREHHKAETSWWSVARSVLLMQGTRVLSWSRN